MNSAAQTAAAEAPEQAMSMEDFWHANGGNGESFYSPGNQFLGWLTGFTNKYKNMYQTYLNNLNIRNEQKAVQSARAWDEFMSNTAYSRAFQDMERVGINPYLLLNSGSTPSTSVGSASKGSYSRSSTGETKSNTKGRDAALIMLAIARIIAAL